MMIECDKLREVIICFYVGVVPQYSTIDYVLWIERNTYYIHIVWLYVWYIELPTFEIKRDVLIC